jgi:branched-chain amino acid transport system permease protein
MLSDPTYWAQAVVIGLMNGAVYALVGISMTLVFGVLRLINFAHGALVTVGMYLSLVAFAPPLGMNPYVALLPGIVVLFLFGVALYVGVLDRVMQTPLLMQLTFTLGLVIALEALLEMIFLNDPLRVRVPGASARIVVGELYVSQGRLVAFAAAIAMAAALWVFLTRSWWGAAIRAVAQNPGAAQLVGIPRMTTLAIAFGIATAAAGAAGMLVTPFLTIFPHVGHSFLGAAFAAIVIGTEGNVIGALIGGLIVGLAESLGVVAFGDEYKDACLFGLVLLMLVFKPQGLFGGTR